MNVAEKSICKQGSSHPTVVEHRYLRIRRRLLNLRCRRGEATKVEGICVADGDGHDDDEHEEEEGEEEEEEEEEESQIPEDADDEVTHIPNTQNHAQSQSSRNEKFEI